MGMPFRPSVSPLGGLSILRLRAFATKRSPRRQDIDCKSRHVAARNGFSMLGLPIKGDDRENFSHSLRNLRWPRVWLADVALDKRAVQPRRRLLHALGPRGPACARQGTTWAICSTDCGSWERDFNQ